MILILFIFLLHQDSMANSLQRKNIKEIKEPKKIKVKLYLLSEIDMLLMVEKGGICHAIYRYVKFNSKYMKNDKNKKS